MLVSALVLYLNCIALSQSETSNFFIHIIHIIIIIIIIITVVIIILNSLQFCYWVLLIVSQQFPVAWLKFRLWVEGFFNDFRKYLIEKVLSQKKARITWNTLQALLEEITR